MVTQGVEEVVRVVVDSVVVALPRVLQVLWESAATGHRMVQAVVEDTMAVVGEDVAALVEAVVQVFLPESSTQISKVRRQAMVM